MRQTVLLVDDDPAHLQIYSGALKNAGYRPIAAVIGQSGVSFPEHENPSLVLMDYRFNSRLGPQEVAALVRDRYPAAKLVLFSSLPELPADMTSVVDGFIRKRDPEILVQGLAMWLERAKSATC
jgi:CheY-like chemotaxis protein